MSKVDYTVEDFVLDPEFRKWVLTSDEAAKIYWERYLKNNPSKYKEIKLATKLVLNISRESHPIDAQRIESTWENINKAVEKVSADDVARRIVPLHSFGSLKKYGTSYRPYSGYHQLYRIAGIFAIAFTLAILANIMLSPKQQATAEAPVVFEEHYAPPGVKSFLTLQDGSKVILNSGSSLRYRQNFEKKQRQLELDGEAYFEVAKDSLRPFKVTTGAVTTTALGTSFNIKAYENEGWSIALLTGKVEVDMKMDQPEKVSLIPGEALNIDLQTQHFQRQGFNEEAIMAWTKKTIIFDHTPISEIIRVLENWYGVQIELKNRPNSGLIISGVFRDQTLENVLEGLSYSGRFQYEIDKNQVSLTFK